ncbi:hypothetical protein OG417_03965 [Actinoallomurus sp. NBC_01490]|jgi:hypothetical protein|uniref:hypothetical protein n=1 Tax=Actinoallomurus sp. NBC_01490 TaxID=2903557 RepID=UPI002E2EAAEC|nr:hypothetical protein [Actinoallomurus sp. NBC_01490]
MKKASMAAAISPVALVLAAASGCGATHTSTRPAAAKQSIINQHAPAAAVQSSSVKRVSFACKSPKGQKLNISYQPALYTTFYFNNHCSQHRHIQIRTRGRYCIDITKTLVVNPHTKGNKKVHTGDSACSITVSST